MDENSQRLRVKLDFV